MRPRQLLWASVACLLSIRARPQEQPSPPDESAAQPSPTPSPPPRLRLDIEKNTQRVLDAHPVPRFETSVDVEARSPQDLLDRHFQDLPCGAVGGVPMQAAGRPTTSPSVDFMAVARAIGEKLRKKGPDRYFIYRIREGERVHHSLRDGPVPSDWLSGVNGTLYELVAAYPDREEAVRALHHQEQGAEAQTMLRPCPPSK